MEKDPAGLLQDPNSPTPLDVSGLEPVTTPMGQVYVIKGKEVGYQSYHFEDDGSYISSASMPAEQKIDSNGDSIPDK